MQVTKHETYFNSEVTILDKLESNWVQICWILFFLIRLVGGGVQLGPLGTAATDWPSVAFPG
jgi:hypothetical protein